MPIYVSKALPKFQRLQPKQPQHALHDWTIPSYGFKVQYDQAKPELPHLDPYGTQLIQYLAGHLSVLFPIFLSQHATPLNEISTQKSKPTDLTIKSNHATS